MTIDEKYIQRCIELAENGLGRTYPNPMVGSVIVRNDRIIGEGWHQRSGQPHAEVNAINSVLDKDLLTEATLYVNLEPCSHYGKTPPCSNLIIESKISRVVIGTVDPFSEVSGKGISRLLKAGCEVVVGIMEKECQALNHRFFTFHLKKRPYIILKWAESEDGFLSPGPGTYPRRPVWITNNYSRQFVHKWRTEEAAIMVGTKTAIADNPKLDARHWHGNNPVRVVLDRQLRIPENSHLFDNSVRTLVLSGQSTVHRSSEKIIYEQIDFEKDLPQQIFDVLVRHELQSLIIEGGRQTLQTFIDSSMWDEARVFTGNVQLKQGIAVPDIPGQVVSRDQIINDTLIIYKNDQESDI